MGNRQWEYLAALRNHANDLIRAAEEQDELRKEPIWKLYEFANEGRVRLAATLAKTTLERDELQRKLADSESFRRAEKEILIAELAAHIETKRKLADAQQANRAVRVAWKPVFQRLDLGSSAGTSTQRVLVQASEIRAIDAAMRGEEKRNAK